MIDPDHKKLSLSRQCQMVNISRSSVYYKPRPISAENLKYMRLIDEQYLNRPFAAAAGCGIICAAWAIRSIASGCSDSCA
jgi:hypothetical protein